MNIIGLIIEGNPIHLGHQYFIKQIYKQYQPDLAIAVTSGNYSMRGELSKLSKFEKTKTYLNLGIDLVFEIPCINVLQSAEYFATSAVNKLHSLGVNKIVCGVEDEMMDLDYLYNLEKTNEFKTSFNTAIKETNSYKKAMINAFTNVTKNEELINKLALPNLTLAYEYYKAIKTNQYDIELAFIKRDSSFKSATLLKTLSNEDIKKDLPCEEELLELDKAYEKVITLFKYHRLNSINNNDSLGQQLNYLDKNINLINSLKDIKNISTKNYSASLLRRVIFKDLLEINNNLTEDYLHLLGASKNGFKYLGTLPNDIKNLIFSTPNDIKFVSTTYNIELNSSNLFSLLLNNDKYYLDEFKFPLKKEE